MKRINILDAAWLAIESPDTPMHIANLQVFHLPKGATTSYIKSMVLRMKKSNRIVPPWNRKLAYPSALGRILSPYWVTENQVDLEYHVRHSALPKPGGERELGILISRLHSQPLDLKKPLWECHIIEGLENRRFAIYIKMHHSLIDGISGVRLLQRILKESPEELELTVPWSIGPKQKSSKNKEYDSPSVQRLVHNTIKTLRAQVSTVPSLVSAFSRLAASAAHSPSELSAPFIGPQSILNGRIGGQRRVATQQYNLNILKDLATASKSSLNDIVLYLCGTALRRFLDEKGCLPESPLTAGIPVNVRPAGDDDGMGTAISFMIASLATDIAEPLARLEAIKNATRTAKEHLQSLPRKALTQYTMLLMSPYILQLVTGLGGRMRPVFNVTISNVPGPSKPLYYEGAELEATYPASLIAHGGALNITCLSYNDKMSFGYTGCRDTLPSMQKLAVYSGEALEELVSLLGK